MSTILAFDVGTKRTGVAVAFAGTNIAVAKDTIVHASLSDLHSSIVALCAMHRTHTIVLGLPLLPSGKEGAQARIVRDLAVELQNTGIEAIYIDERYTTVRNAQYDGDASSACHILSTFLDRTVPSH